MTILVCILTSQIFDLFDFFCSFCLEYCSLTLPTSPALVYFFRYGNCILFDRQSFQYHSDRQQWGAVPKHTGSWNWKNYNDGRRESGGAGGAACVAWGLPLLLLQMLSEKNVRFFMSDSVTEVRGVDGKVTDPNMLSHNKNTVLPSHCSSVLKVKEVVLKSAKVIPADVLIVGIGECAGGISMIISIHIFLISISPNTQILFLSFFHQGSNQTQTFCVAAKYRWTRGTL